MSDTNRDYCSFFSQFAESRRPRHWQEVLALYEKCVDRQIRVPTGFGKTLGVLGAWYYNRVERRDPSWPRRLVWVLPMRVLVEQTIHEARVALTRMGSLWDEASTTHEGRVGVHALMGGANAGDWHLYPEREAVLVGTQDMLLSRALNRGYGAARGRWPMEFGILNTDCLWVLDEVQLMDVGLATSVQLQAFRLQEEQKGLRPCRTWWMSATLQPRWFETPDTTELQSRVVPVGLSDTDHSEAIWSVKKPLERHEPLTPSAWAERAAALHSSPDQSGGRVTLLIANTVDRAVALHGELKRLTLPSIKRKAKGGKATSEQTPVLDGVEVRLVHSRFRPYERTGWLEQFLSREACANANRIIVATQVVEAGVDISASLLMTEIAPWPSLVQRFGRVARYGDPGAVHVIKVEDKQAAPYEGEELAAAWEALGLLDEVGPSALQTLEQRHPERLPALYPYDPRHLLLRQEVDELFDTTPDLTGADIDVSRFIRSTEERDLQVAWFDVAPIETGPAAARRPRREELCAVPFTKAQEWLFGKSSKRLQPGRRAWVWDYLDGSWRRAERADLYPGQVVVVSADSGGYSPEHGFDPDQRDPVPLVPLPTTETGGGRASPQELADASQDAEDLSAFQWKTIATHGREVGGVVERLAGTLGLSQQLTHLLNLAGRWHDVGKSHPAFQASIKSSERPARHDLAKAPAGAWRAPCDLYKLEEPGPPRRRRGFRHELASALALFAVLRRGAPDHPALLGPWREALEACEVPVEVGASAESGPPGPLEQEILALDAPGFDLLAYLVCSHHGKVRARLHATPHDQEYRASPAERAQVGSQPPMPVRGVLEGDRLPGLLLSDATGRSRELPSSLLTLAPASAGLSGSTGASWLDRVQGLLRVHGPFTLAWLEALLRAADIHASRLETTDELLAKQVRT